MPGDPLLSVPYLQKESQAASPRYRWNNWERGEQPYVILQWTLAGEGEIDAARVPEGHAFVALVPERSSYGFPANGGEPWVFGWVNFYGELALDLFRGFRDEFGPVIPLPRRSAAAASLRRLVALAGAPRPDRWQVSLRAYAFILDWRRQSTQPSQRGEDRLEWVIRFCRERFREPLTVKELAEEAGMSREHFSRVFAQRTRQTPAAFLRRLRLEEATALLRETQLPLEEIAMRSGFYSARQLMLTVQRVSGANPSDLRGARAS